MDTSRKAEFVYAVVSFLLCVSAFWLTFVLCANSLEEFDQKLYFYLFCACGIILFVGLCVVVYRPHVEYINAINAPVATAPLDEAQVGVDLTESPCATSTTSPGCIPSPASAAPLPPCPRRAPKMKALPLAWPPHPGQEHFFHGNALNHSSDNSHSQDNKQENQDPDPEGQHRSGTV